MNSLYAGIFGFALVVANSACVSQHVERDQIANFSTETVQPGASVKRAGTPVQLVAANGDIADALSSIELTDSKWQPLTLQPNGTVRIISIVPSIDTLVCEQQTHLLSETESINPKVQRITISKDLPSAQQRFATESGLTNVTFVSDYKAGAFGQATGLTMTDSGLLARAVLVVDQKGEVRHMQVVPDVTQLPDLARAIEVANSLVEP